MEPTGKGHDVMMTRDGEVAIATGPGEGKRTETGKIRYPGVIFFKTRSNDKLAFLNHMIGVNEYKVDEWGGYKFKCWEWK
jgi:hypothetical protein